MNNYLKLAAVSCLTISSFVSLNASDDPNKGFDPSQMDLSVKPTDDFYGYAVGTWVKTAKIPDDKSSWGVFAELGEKSYDDLHSILEDLNKEKPVAGSISQKVRDFYDSGMNTEAIDKEGITSLAPFFKDIDTISDKKSFAAENANLQRYGISPLFGIYGDSDQKNSDMVIMNIGQGGLGLPSDYYLIDDATFKKFREEYVKYIAKIFAIYGYDDKNASSAAEKIMEFETALAKVSKTPEQLRDPVANYNKMSLAELEKISPDFDWQIFFADINFKEQSLNVGQPEFFKGMSSLLDKTSTEDLKNYLRWNVLNSMAPCLGTAYFNANFDFYSKTLSGIKEMKPRWKTVIEAENGLMGEALGELYVKQYFPPEVKEKALKIVHTLIDSLKERIAQLKWMGEDTKKQALKKLSMFTIKIGYPDKWIDYSKLKITPDSYTQNCLAANKFNVLRNLDKIGKPKDRTEWGMNPQTVNAYYNPLNNEIVFPAAILQPPFFNPDADDAVNYGAMGVVIGHEITHGFDDQGRMFDGKGNMENWWTDEDAKNFKETTEKLAKQFDSYEPLKGYHINGNLTLGENIADLGGLVISYNAFQKTDEYREGKKIDGFTPQQRFFLSFAQVWRSKMREQTMLMRLKTDPHSPPQYRVDGPLPNITAFDEAFNVKQGDKMYKTPEDRIVIW